MYRTDEEINELYEKVRDLTAKGIPASEIAARLGISTNAVYRYRKGVVGIKLRDYGYDRRMALTAEQIEEMRRLHAAGVTYRELAATFKVSYTCVCYWLNKKYRQTLIRCAADRSTRLREDPDFLKDFYKKTGERAKRRAEIVNQIVMEDK